jgi:hypothetical protein
MLITLRVAGIALQKKRTSGRDASRSLGSSHRVHKMTLRAVIGNDVAVPVLGGAEQLCRNRIVVVHVAPVGDDTHSEGRQVAIGDSP